MNKKMSRLKYVGQWLPGDNNLADKWLTRQLNELKTKRKDGYDLMLKLYPSDEGGDCALKDQPHLALEGSDLETLSKTLHPSVAALVFAIESDTEINRFFHQMFWQQYQLPEKGGVKIPCWQVAVLLIDIIIDTAPEYNNTDLVGFPINRILNWPMATTAGFAAFLNHKVNKLLKGILNEWGEFLTSPASTYVLNEDEHTGWFGKDAMKAMPNFVKEFECDPSKPHHGFKSWDDFFVRKFRPGMRPVASPNDDNVVANACESAPFKLERNVKRRDYFWIKNQNYSLDHMLNNSNLAEKFYGGTVYQGFLGATNYHRWHSPVSGSIFKTELVDGSYYSQTYDIRNDPAAPNDSQAYISHVAARAIVYIQADNPDIGLMVFIAVGMCEVSSNEITVKVGDVVKKGDEIGMFHYGGSTHCLVFQPSVNIEFDLRGQTPGPSVKKIIKMRSKIAVVSPPAQMA